MKKKSLPIVEKTTKDTQILTPEEMVYLNPVRATQPMPDFSEPNEKIDKIEIRLNNKNELVSVSPKEKTKASVIKTKNQIKIEINSIADKDARNKTGKTHEFISNNKLLKDSYSIKKHTAFRPQWLDLNYAPKIIPHLNKELVKSKGKECSNNLNLFTVHTLELVNYLSYPWCTIGFVSAGNGNDFNHATSSGTGVLVGRNLLLTASHVAPWDRAPGTWWMRFVPAYNNGNGHFGHSYVEHFRGVRNIDDVTGLDYVICKLYTPLGDRTGWMGSQAFSNDDDYYRGRWTSVGYPNSFFGSQRAAVEYNLKIEDVDNDGDGRELETYVFSSKGWSGGPLWGWINNEPKVIGIMSGNEEEFAWEEHSVSAGGMGMVNLIRFGQNNWKP